MDRLVNRLFKRHLPADIDPRDLAALKSAMIEAVEAQEHDRRMLERSMMIMSDELNEINTALEGQLKETKATRDQLHRSLLHERTLLDATPEAVFNFHKNGNIRQYNKAARDLIESYNLAFSKNPGVRGIKRQMRILKEPTAVFKMFREVISDKETKIQGLVETIDDRFFEFTSLPETLDGEYLGRVFCLRDITKLKQNQAQLHHQAYHDALTGLPNRFKLHDELKQRIDQAQRKGTKVAIFFIDLDNFKTINDTLGHSEGDKFLLTAAEELRKSLGHNDVIGRLGGDEFVLIISDVISPIKIINAHDNIVRRFSEPFYVKGHEYRISCSIGISLYPQDSDNASALIRKADMAMYHAKHMGKNRFHYFDESLERNALERVKLESDLMNAIAHDEFELYLQPKVSLLTGSIIGTEALLRWVKPDGRIILPNSFIPAAEETGLIKDITTLVIEKACQILKSWRHTALNNVPLAINTSAIDFSRVDFLQHTIHQVEAHDIPFHLLELELTESAFLTNFSQAKAIIDGFHAAGFRIAIDDFGKGYSSLRYLHQLKVNQLKVDKSFTANVENDRRQATIVKSVIDVGKNLGLDVVVEGVETAAQLEALVELGCEACQGIFYAEPVPQAQFLSEAQAIGIEPRLAMMAK